MLFSWNDRGSRNLSFILPSRVTLFPDNAGEMTAFGLVQHNFFIFFNAAIGLLFLRRANRDLLTR